MSSNILIGPAGTSGLGYEEGFEKVKQLKLDCLEVEYTYGVRMSNEEAKRIGQLAKEKNIKLSIHAPYYINLNSEEKPKVLASKIRILQCCERGQFFNRPHIVFHPGFYGKDSKEQTYQDVKKEIIDLLKTIKQKKLDVVLAPETTGKISQFGDLDELLRMRKETGCSLCIDFAHLKARNNGVIDYDEVFRKIKGIDHIHSHFSGIEWTPKGEKRHLITEKKDIKELLLYIKKYKVNVTIINESPDPFGDCMKTKELL